MDRDEWDRRYAVREFVGDTGPNRFVAEELSALPPGLALDLDNLAHGTGARRIPPFSTPRRPSPPNCPG